MQLHERYRRSADTGNRVHFIIVGDVAIIRRYIHWMRINRAINRVLVHPISQIIIAILAGMGGGDVVYWVETHVRLLVGG